MITVEYKFKVHKDFDLEMCMAELDVFGINNYVIISYNAVEDTVTVTYANVLNPYEAEILHEHVMRKHLCKKPIKPEKEKYFSPFTGQWQ